MKIEENKSLKDINSFRVDVTAKRVLTLENEDDFSKDKIINEFPKDDYIILGECSNTLFTKDFDGTVVLIKNKGIEVLNDTKEYVLVKVAAGENWANFVEWSVKQNLLGLQNLVDIPGNVGACPVQNIGAYGTEVKEYITEVEIVDLASGESRALKNEQCQFGYRDSIFKHDLKGRVVIKSVTFKLGKYLGTIDDKYVQYAGIQEKIQNKELTLENLFNIVREIRKEKLPSVGEYGSCGSTFKNLEITEEEYAELTKKFPELPKYNTSKENIVKVPTAYILEKLGWKNRREGDVGTWMYHPLIVTNYGNASASEIDTFIKRMQNDFKSNTGFNLETEINII